METNFKNLKTEKEKIEFLKEKIKEYFIPFEKGSYITKGRWGWSFVNFPSWEGFRVKYGISKRFMDEKVKANPDLQEELSFCNDIIRDIIMKGGFSGGYNPKFTALAAQNILKWTAKSETKETGRQSSVIINILNERKKRKLPTIMETTAKKLTKQAKLVKLAKKSSLHSDNSSEDIPVEVDKLGDS